jgi:predicted PurR-regulated permease PerM
MNGLNSFPPISQAVIVAAATAISVSFLLNFIPFVGAFLMTIPAVLMAIVQTDLPTTLLVALGYLVANTVIGSILGPRIMGHGLGISALAVFLSLLFWGWVLGTVDVFLAVPLTMALIVALEASPQTRPIAILLGPAVTQKPETEEETSV